MNYRTIFLSLLESLKENKYIDVLNDRVREPIDETFLDFVLSKADFRVSDHFLEFYRNMNGAKITWSCDLNRHNDINKCAEYDQSITGRIDILSLQDMIKFDSKIDSSIWTESMEMEEKADLYRFRYFDHNDDSILVGFIAEEGELSNQEIVYLEQGSDGFCLVDDISFDEYIQAMLSVKGFQGWQYALFYKEGVVDLIDKMKFYLRQLFPEDTVENF